jgi:SAM-dependent methyltransferase
MLPEVELQANSINEIHYKVMEIIKDYPKGKALDFPSGYGRLSCWLQKKGHHVISCDISPESYKNDIIHHSQADMNKEFPFDNNTFDYAFCIEGPEHSENLYHTFREFFRVLKPNGTFISSIPNYSNIESRFKQFLYGVLEPVATKEDFEKAAKGTGCFHINRPSYAMLKMALEAAGFKVSGVFYDKGKTCQIFFYPLYLLIKLVTLLKGKRGNKKYWLKDSNSRNVLMGGNTLIVVSKKE